MIEGILIGAGVFVAGLITGRWWPARRKGPKPPKPVEPVCGCEHHVSYHADGTGKCHGRTPLGLDENLNRTYGPCGCQHYSGPVPLPEYYAPEIGP